MMAWRGVMVLVALAESSCPAWAAGYYAAPNGSGTACSQAIPCTVQQWLNSSQAAPGNTLWLLDGVYQGAANVIRPPAGKSGTDDANRIAIKVLNEGQVLIDGQFAREAIRLNNNDWWLFEGFNAKNGPGTGVVYLTNGSDNNVFRRFVAWDVNISSNNNILIHEGSSGHNLYEDCGLFGPARKIAGAGNPSTGNKWRRCWMRWEGNAFGANVGITLGYNSHDAVFENVLVTASGELQPHTWTNFNGVTRTNYATELNAVIGVDRLQSTTVPKNTNSVVRGVLSYTKRTDRHGGVVSGGVIGGTTNGFQIFGSSAWTLNDVITVMDPAHPNFNDRVGFALVRRPHNCPGLSATLSASGGCLVPPDPTPQPDHPNFVVANNVATRLTSIRGTKTSGTDVGDTFGRTGVSGYADENDWGANLTGLSSGTSLVAVQSPWQNTSSTGARLCFQTVDGVVTTTPLWPFPMNDRIKAATAMAGVYGAGYAPDVYGCGVTQANCKNANGTPYTFPARTVTDVTADIEALLGIIPAECKSGVSPPTFPAAPGFPSTSVLDNFGG